MAAIFQQLSGNTFYYCAHSGLDKGRDDKQKAEDELNDLHICPSRSPHRSHWVPRLPFSIEKKTEEEGGCKLS